MIEIIIRAITLIKGDLPSTILEVGCGIGASVICERINYYSAESFCELASIAGFKVLEIRNDADNYEYDVYLQKDEHTLPDLNAKKAQDRKEIQSY